MRWHRMACASAVVLGFLLSLATYANAVEVGCYPVKELELNTLAEVGSDETPASAAACEDACYAAESPKPLSVWMGGRCMCTAAIPDVFTKLPPRDCVESATNSAGAATAAATFVRYKHHVAQEACTVAPVPFFRNWWQDREGLRVNFSAGQHELLLEGKDDWVLNMRLTKNLGAIKMFTVDAWRYGYYTIKMIPFGPGIGAVTTFYTTSSYADEEQPPENRIPFDEINLSFPSSYPREFPETMRPVERVRAAIGALWTKNWRDGEGFNETLFPANDLQTLTGDANFSAFDGLTTYGFNWQPKALDWFVKGVNIDRIPDAHPLPKQAARLGLGMWRPPGHACWGFGGCNNSEPYEAKFADVRRVVCGDKKLIDTYNSMSYSPSPPPPPSPFPSPPPMPPRPPLPPGKVAEPEPTTSVIPGLNMTTDPMASTLLPGGAGGAIGFSSHSTVLTQAPLLLAATAAAALMACL